MQRIHKRKSSYVVGAKTPLFVYNKGIKATRTVPWIGNNQRAGYHALWSFPINGAQTDIFTRQYSDQAKANAYMAKKKAKKSNIPQSFAHESDSSNNTQEVVMDLVNSETV